LDHVLVEHTAALPERLKLRGLTTKWVLRRAMRDILPEPILSRRKLGFPVPVGAWFRGEYRGMLRATLAGDRAAARGLFEPAAVRRLIEEHGRRERDHSERLWSLLNLELWHRRFVDGDEAAIAPAAGERLAAGGA